VCVFSFCPQSQSPGRRLPGKQDLLPHSTTSSPFKPDPTLFTYSVFPKFALYLDFPFGPPRYPFHMVLPLGFARPRFGLGAGFPVPDAVFFFFFFFLNSLVFLPFSASSSSLIRFLSVFGFAPSALFFLEGDRIKRLLFALCRTGFSQATDLF